MADRLPTLGSGVGVLLVNLGTPAAPTAEAVRPYLRQFLSDRQVIDYPPWLWQPLLQGIILNLRPRKSARLYASIWTPEGSPIHYQSLRIAEKLEARLGSAGSPTGGVPVIAAMRYGQPSIPFGLEKMAADGVEQVLVLPLFPQYSATTTATVFDEVFRWRERHLRPLEIRTVDGYHDHPFYTAAIADSVRRAWEGGRSDLLVFSYHGIPRRYARRGDPYEQNCRRTTELVAAQLGLSAEDHLLSFQSRFGPEAWLQPYTIETMGSLPAKGVKRIHLVCPGFAVDCLETLEEIAVLNKKAFLEAGGDAFHYVPCLNDGQAQIDLLEAIASEALAGWLD